MIFFFLFPKLSKALQFIAIIPEPQITWMLWFCVSHPVCISIGYWNPSVMSHSYLDVFQRHCEIPYFRLSNFLQTFTDISIVPYSLLIHICCNKSHLCQQAWQTQQIYVVLLRSLFLEKNWTHSPMGFSELTLF